jgi:hypothetical protein
MTGTIGRTLLVAVLSLGATVALANDDGLGKGKGWGPPPPPPPPPPRHTVSAPELDPAQGAAALTLLAGTIAILRARRWKKK